MAERIGVGLSGGVDSAYAALLLLRQGWDVRGYTMLLTDDQREDARRAAEIAGKLGIPHAVLDFRGEFSRRILEYFTEEYRRGRTPSPCVRCNRLVKFGLLWDAMQADGCSRMATGHYARLEEGIGGERRLLRGKDLRKDQSYFLGWVPQQMLEKVVFPLQNVEKSEVREQAVALVDRKQRESQDLCFLPNGHFEEFVAARDPSLRRRGRIVDGMGKTLGSHNGAYAYTVGQRRGLGLGGGPWFVQETDVPANLVRVTREMPRCCHVELSDMNWLCRKPGEGEVLPCQVQLRYRMAPCPAEICGMCSGTVEVRFLGEPSKWPPCVPSGQFACCYDGDRVLGGGWISANK